MDIGRSMGWGSRLGIGFRVLDLGLAQGKLILLIPSPACTPPPKYTPDIIPLYKGLVCTFRRATVSMLRAAIMLG